MTTQPPSRPDKKSREPDAAALQPGSSRARTVRSRDSFDRSQDDLARLGALVRALRLEHGLGTRALARRATACRSTIQRLERGQLRPRPSLLQAIAWGLDPDRAPKLRRQLLDAAGENLAPDTQGWRRYRWRRQELGMATGAVPLPREIARRVEAHRREAEARREADALLDGLGALDDAEILARAHELMTVACRAAAEAGGVIQIGRVMYGLSW